MTNLPTALVLAKKIEDYNRGVMSQAIAEDYAAAAAELRRLHARVCELEGSANTDTNAKQNPVARAIVANLAFRARLARRSEQKLQHLAWHAMPRNYVAAQYEEARNAYVASRKILQWGQP